MACSSAISCLWPGLLHVPLESQGSPPLEALSFLPVFESLSPNQQDSWALGEGARVVLGTCPGAVRGLRLF